MKKIRFKKIILYSCLSIGLIISFGFSYRSTNHIEQKYKLNKNKSIENVINQNYKSFIDYDNLSNINDFKIHIKSETTYKSHQYITNHDVYNKQFSKLELVSDDWKSDVYNWDELANSYIDEQSNNKITYINNENKFIYNMKVIMVSSGNYYDPPRPIYKTQILDIIMKNKTFKLNNKWTENSSSLREFSNQEATIDVNLTNPFNSCFLNVMSENEFNFNKLFRIDKTKTFRGFNSNNFSLEIDNDYIKSLIILSRLKAKALVMLQEANQEELNDINYIKIIQALYDGKIIDTSDEIIKKYYTLDYSNSKYNLLWYLDRYNSNDFSYLDILDNETNDIYEYSINNNLKINDEYLAYKLLNLFDKQDKNNNYKINYSYKGNDYQTQFKIEWDNNTKRFILVNSENNEELLISFNEKPDEFEPIIIKSVTTNTPLLGTLNIDFRDGTKQINLQESSYVSNPEWSITNLFSFNDVYNKKQINLLLNKQMESNNLASNLLVDKNFIYNLFTFNKYNLITKSSLTILDNQLKKYLIDSNLSLINNLNLNQIVKKINLKAFDSVNGIEIILDFFDVSRHAKIQSNNIITKKIRLIINEQPKMIINKINGNKFYVNNETFNNLESNILSLIKYNDSEIDDYFLSTNLNKTDWIENILSDFKIIGVNQNSKKVIIEYHPNINQLEWLNFKKQSNNIERMEFDIICNDLKLENKTNQKNISKPIIIFSCSFIVLIFIMIIIAFVVRMKILNKQIK